jgi:hypothetical protein
MPSPVGHVGQQQLAGRCRQHLPCHGPRDRPEFEVDDRPHDDPGATGQFERRPVDDRRKGAAFTWDHPISNFPTKKSQLNLARHFSTGKPLSLHPVDSARAAPCAMQHCKVNIPAPR